MSVREIYAVLLIGAMLLFSLIYTSFALFEKSVERVGIASIVASEINFTLTSDENNFIINGNSGTITVASGETKTFNITITNGLANTTKYKMYYRFAGDVTILGVDVGVSSNSESPVTDLIASGLSKTVRIIITNTSSQAATLEIGVQGGYAANTVVLNTGRNEMNVIEEALPYSTFTDTSGANEPVLADGMIPVVYDDDNDVWVKADTEKGWYAYQEQVWANAVTVTSTNRSTYLNAEPGTPIPMDDINSMWVWIPRYRYNISSNIGSSSAITEPPQIDVVFETGTETNGVTETVYRNGISDDGTNTNYYTHPAFRNLDNIEYDSSTTSRGAWDEEITGFWVAKFEPGTSNETCNTSGSADNCADVEPIIKPDVQSLSYQTVSTRFITALKFAGGTFDSSTGEVTFTANENNVYGLNTTTNTTDTHMMKNTEWGAVAILSQSQYGKMGNANYTGTNKEVYKNNSYSSSTSSYTGRSSGVPPAIGYSTYGTYSYNDKACSTDVAECTGDKVAYAGTGASTTGTIYGVYDMSGGLFEYTMGNYASTTSSSGFTTFPSSKYYDLYNGTILSNITKEKAILGDATWETMKWYSDNDVFVTASTPWFMRGGSYSSNARVGVFYSDSHAGSANNVAANSFRPLLIP